ncbi:MAG: ABC transporter substrate-binding protein, partial [Corynebacterium sp.]|nr:ABC transporter substrate-binding protein [Corynebacterium sp.]
SEGDDISVEAIADSNPDLMIVMDRDAATSANSGEEYTPANQLIADSAALQNVTAVKDDRIVYMPQFTYVDEGIQTYTEFFNTLADALEKK